MADLNVRNGSDNTIIIDTLGPGVGYGSAGLVIGNILGAVEARSILLFDISSIPSGSTIDEATLTVVSTGEGTEDGSGTYRCYRITRAITGSDLESSSWDNYREDGEDVSPWTTPGGDYTTTNGDSDQPDDEEDDLIFDQLAAITQTALDDDGVLRVILLSDSPMTNSFTVYSGNEAVEVNRPLLEIIYQPPDGPSGSTKRQVIWFR